MSQTKQLHDNFTATAAGEPRPASLLRAEAPVSILFDTDMGNDIDDALALAVLHALQGRGACDLLAVTLSNPDPDAPHYVKALNTFYNYPQIPVGRCQQGPFIAPGTFLEVAHRTDSDGTPLMPCQHTPTQHAVALMRQCLAKADDASVVIVQTGFFTNCAALLRSEPDAISPLSGTELIARKVRFLSAMAGAFGPVNANNRWLEFNVVYDIPAAQHVAAHWPVPIVWSGCEVGIAIPLPTHAITEDCSYLGFHPISESYQRFRPVPHRRPTWDLTSALFGVYPERDYFSLSTCGNVHVSDDGFTHFKPQPQGRDYYLSVSSEQAFALQHIFALLISQPPLAAAPKGSAADTAACKQKDAQPMSV